MKLSIIVPVWNESATLPALLDHLQLVRANGVEVIVVDGGSSDGSTDIVSRAGVRVIRSEHGRARQMNAGARAAAGDVLLFLHADTRLPDGATEHIAKALQDHRQVWGRFDVEVQGTSRMLRVVARFINLRSRLTGIETGDQAMFVARRAFRMVGGYPDQPLMEDVELSRRLRELSWPVCLRAQVRTSGRRWETRGVWKTILLMWRLRWSYWWGASAEDLARMYR